MNNPNTPVFYDLLAWMVAILFLVLILNGYLEYTHYTGDIEVILNDVI